MATPRHPHYMDYQDDTSVDGSVRSSRTAGDTASQQSWDSVKPLKPASKTMQLGMRNSLAKQTAAAAARKQPGAGAALAAAQSLAGKPASERLYYASQLSHQRKAAFAAKKKEDEEKELKKIKFKLNKNSRDMAQRMRPSAAPGGQPPKPVELRLYDEGKTDQLLKDKRSADLKERLQKDEWSCARCGTFQRVSTASVVIQPLHMVSRALKVNDINCRVGVGGGWEAKGSQQPQPERICSNCGWNQNAVKPFKPVNIGLELVVERDLDADLPERVQQKLDEQHGGAENIHEYLYANASQRENLQQLNRVFHEEHNSTMTFTPAIPESSQRLIGKYKKDAMKKGRRSEAAEIAGGRAGTENCFGITSRDEGTLLSGISGSLEDDITDEWGDL